MKITDTYKALKKKHTRFFSEYNADDRIKHKKEIISLKKSLDELEIKIITGILNYSLSYSRVMNELKDDSLNNFLKDNVGISRFLTSQKLSKSIGFNENQRNNILEEYHELCEKAWEDYIISSDERKKLNEFCKENLIDKTQQFLIEQKVSKKYTDGFDLEKVVKHYIVSENKSNDEIKSILNKEYKKNVSIEKIISLSNQLNKEIINEFELEEGDSKLIKTIKVGDSVRIYIIIVNSKLNSGYEFEIGFEENEMDSFKLIVSKSLYDTNNIDRFKDVITDGICYYLASRNDGNYQLKHFLELKPNVREVINNAF